MVPTFTLMNFTITTSPESIDFIQSTRPLFNNPLTHPTIKLRRIKIFETKLSILSKFCEEHIWHG